MTDLIARLKAAPEGSRELDGRIAVVINYRFEDVHGRKFKDIIADFGYRNMRTTDWDSWHVPHYTTSLDVALTLVPEGFRWSIDHDEEIPREPGKPTYADVSQYGHSNNPVYKGWAATAPLALCIAALLAVNPYRRQK